jgi:hypothetical protein
VPGPLGGRPVNELAPWVREMERQLRGSIDTIVAARMAAQAPTDRKGTPVAGKFAVELQLGPADRARVAAHLAESAVMLKSAYLAGAAHPPTAEIVDFAERLAAAVGDSTAVATVAFAFDRDQALKIRRWLLAAKERSGDVPAVGEAVGRLVREWDLATGFNPRREAADAARPPRVVAETGGWDSV